MGNDVEKAYEEYLKGLDHETLISLFAEKTHNLTREYVPPTAKNQNLEEWKIVKGEILRRLTGQNEK